MSKPGRKLDRKQTNRRQKHELDYRARKWRCPKLAVILADMCSDLSKLVVSYPISAEMYIWKAKEELGRASRATSTSRKPKIDPRIGVKL